jgi:NAD(P)-dependent dehydrogenase (short-subunit alcohol dehydrogenase family)
VRLEGKVALITGADGPVGTATALRFAREGAIVVLNDIVSTHLDRVATEIAQVEGGKALIALGDVTRPPHVERMVREAIDAFGRLDILVNHAGDNEAIAFTGASLCAEAIVPLMRERGWGRVINSSRAATLTPSGPAPTDAGGASVISLTKALALEHAPFGVTVNCVAPGVTMTAVPIPMGRLGDPHAVAAAHVFLASDEAGYITGQVLFVDGGMSLVAYARRLRGEMP